MQNSRTKLLQLSDADLLKLCEVSAYKGSGPGGQHRNKTSTGVKLNLEVTNHENPLIKKIMVQTFSCDDRSAHVNKLLALKKLRMKIALQIREKPATQTPFSFPGSNGKISPDNALYPQFIADILDRLDNFDEAAKIWGLSKSALNKIMLQDKKVMEAFQKHRQCQAEKTRQTACQSTANQQEPHPHCHTAEQDPASRPN